MSMRLIPYVFIWVSWNTMLAVIPVVAAYYIHRMMEEPGKSRLTKLYIILLGLVWLGFLPNTCYLLTEWRHFLHTVGYSQLFARWEYDAGAALKLGVYTLFFLCFSGVGVLTFTLAVRPIAAMARERGAALWVWGLPFFLLMAIGVYLGLVLRFNSWDLFLKPAVVWGAALALIYHPVLNLFILGFAAFLWIVYLAMDIWVDGFVVRWRAWLG